MKKKVVNLIICILSFLILFIFVISNCPLSEVSSNDKESSYIVKGILDSAFGTNGVATGGINGSDDRGENILTDSSGKILVVGYIDGLTRDMAIWRYNSNGTPDTTFGGDGYDTHDNAAEKGSESDIGYSMALDSNKNIVIAGTSYDDMAIWRYTSDGTLDTTFGYGNGYVTDDYSSGLDDQAFGVVLDSTGNIFVAGHSFSSSNYDMLIWKYTTDGTLDTSFGANGIVIYDITNSAAGKSIAIDQNNNLYVTGYIDNGFNNDMAVWKYDASGDIDNSFGSGGIVTKHGTAGGDGGDQGNKIITDTNGSVFVSGCSESTSDIDMVIWKFLSDGTPDTTFGSPNGFVTHHNAAGGSGTDKANDIVLDQKGNILVTGESKNSSMNTDIVVWRFTSKGILDTSFNNPYGYIVDDMAAARAPMYEDAGIAITLDSAGKVLITGFSDNSSDYDMVILRYK